MHDVMSLPALLSKGKLSDASSQSRISQVTAGPDTAFDQQRCIVNVNCIHVQEGASYKVKVVRLMDYGAFVELPNGFQALLHISELAHERVICP